MSRVGEELEGKLVPPINREENIRSTDQGKRITRGKLGKMGKNVFKVALSEIPRKQGIFEIRPYNRLIVIANIGFGDISMSLEKAWKTREI